MLHISYYDKDDNIHKKGSSETVFDKIICKFVAKLLKYRILLKGKLIFLGLDYRDASVIVLYFIVIGIR